MSLFTELSKLIYMKIVEVGERYSNCKVRDFGEEYHTVTEDKSSDLNFFHTYTWKSGSHRDYYSNASSRKYILLSSKERGYLQLPAVSVLRFIGLSLGLDLEGLCPIKQKS